MLYRLHAFPCLTSVIFLGCVFPALGTGYPFSALGTACILSGSSSDWFNALFKLAVIGQMCVLFSVFVEKTLNRIPL